MVRSGGLIALGFWGGPSSDATLPDPRDFVDAGWDPDERDLVAQYLRSGFLVRAYMGYSRCRICDRENGDADLTDGVFIWPDGLAHYIVEHEVRLPDIFVRHALKQLDIIENAPRDESWWREQRPDARWKSRET